MLDEVKALSKIKDKSINDVIKATKFLFLCSRELYLHQQTWGIPLNGCCQERFEFPGRLPQIIFCLIHFQ